jgi:hypothetical protein
MERAQPQADKKHSAFSRQLLAQTKRDKKQAAIPEKRLCTQPAF